MQDLFLAYIKEHALFTPADKLLLAVSGGLDSVVMTHLFSQAHYSFGIAHANFGLRANESEADASFVAALARDLGVPFYTTRLDAAKTASAQGISLQMAARELRYHWFDQLCRQDGYTRIALAHHLSDQAETQLLNLSRGTGLAGLRGMRPRRGRLVRPLLFASRQELEDYARQQGLRWREDSSNSTLKYRRNKVRHQLIPLLKELNPRLEWSMQETARRLAAAERIIGRLVQELREKHLEAHGSHYMLQLQPILQQPEARYLLAELLSPFGGGWNEAGSLLEMMQQEQNEQSGKWLTTSSHRLNLDRQQLVISTLRETEPEELWIQEEQQEVLAGTSRLAFRMVAAEGYQLNADPAVAALDYQKLHFPLQLRPPRPGDWFIPLGMRGKKKLSDFMIDRKIPVNLKQEVLLVLSGEAIAWVAGYRPDERFKIDANTRHILEIRLHRP